MSFWNRNKKNDDNANNDDDPKAEQAEQVEEEGVHHKAAASMFDILAQATELVEGAGGLPSNEEDKGHENGTCEERDCPFAAIESIATVRRWTDIQIELHGEDFIIGQSTPDANPLVKFLREYIPANLGLESSRLMTSDAGELFVINIDMSGASVYTHPLPGWTKEFIAEIIENDSIGNHISAKQTKEILEKIA